MKRQHRSILPAAIIAIAAMVVASCGSSSSSGGNAQGTPSNSSPSQSSSSSQQASPSSPQSTASGSNGGSGSAAPSSTPPRTSLTIGQISKSVAFFPIFVARDKGYFAQQGLTVNDPSLLGTGAKLAAALVSGSIDVGGGVMTDAFNTANAGQHVKVIANLVNEYYVDIIVGTGVKVAPESASLIDKIKSLKGLKIGITGPGSGNEALVTYLFKLAGMNSSTDATLVNLGSQATAVVGALKTHRVDALSFFQPIGQEVEAQGLGTIYISPARGDVPDMAGETHGVAMASAGALANKKPALLAYIKGIAQAEKFIHDGSAAEVGQLLQKYETNLDAKTVASLVPTLQKEIPATPVVTQKGYEIAVQFHEKAGLVAHPPTFDTMIDSSLISEALGG